MPLFLPACAPSDCPRPGYGTGAGKQGTILPHGRQWGLLIWNQEDRSIDGEFQEGDWWVLDRFLTQILVFCSPGLLDGLWPVGHLVCRSENELTITKGLIGKKIRNWPNDLIRFNIDIHLKHFVFLKIIFLCVSSIVLVGKDQVILAVRKKLLHTQLSWAER